MNEDQLQLIRLLLVEQTFAVGLQINAGTLTFSALAELEKGSYATSMAHQYCQWHRRLLKEIFWDELLKRPRWSDHFAAYAAVDRILKHYNIYKTNYVNNKSTYGSVSQKTRRH